MKHWRVGFSDGSGPEYVREEGDDKSKSIAKVRWGCSCCEDTSPLEDWEKANVALLAAAPEMAEVLHRIYAKLTEGKSVNPYEYRAVVWEVLCKATPDTCRSIMRKRIADAKRKKGVR